MLDMLYVIGTVAFFGLMLAYVRGCEGLGHETEPDEDRVQ